ncbi:MAG: thiamine pyrophosphate-binding protein [Deltaproteobacteria bacterium]|nr:thiamine pyrophosphate-binding protein [Deltaproteobacteria bacterium]
MTESIKKLQGGHLLAKSIRAKGIQRVFALAGGFVNPIYDGLCEYGLDLVGARSEQEAGFLACMQARITRKPSVCIAEPSGFTNYISAAAEAYHAQDPVIFISANSISHRWDRKGFKETEQAKMMEPITKYSIVVNDGKRIPEFFDKAYHIAVNHPTGPVQLSIPVNFLYSRYDTSVTGLEREFDLSKIKVHQSYPGEDDIALVVDRINQAKKPVIIAAGEAVWWEDADQVLQDFCNKTGVPTFNPTWHIKMHDLSHRMNMGLADIHQNPASRLIYQESDLVIFLGCPLDFSLDFAEPPLFNPNTFMIAVNPTAKELSDNHAANILILSHIKTFLEALNKRTSQVRVDPGWAEKIRSQRQEHNQKHLQTATSNEKPIHPLRICLDVLHSLNENDYLCIDGGDIYGWLETALNIFALEGRRIKGLIHSGPFDQLGSGVSFATAVKMNHPDSKVVLISGDGAFGLAPGLPPETAIHYNAPITIVLAKNKAWGMINQQQKAIWNREFKTELRDVPYSRIVQGMGGYGEFVENPEDIQPALKRAFDSQVPSLIDVASRNIISPITQGLTDMRERSSAE